MQHHHFAAEHKERACRRENAPAKTKATFTHVDMQDTITRVKRNSSIVIGRYEYYQHYSHIFIVNENSAFLQKKLKKQNKNKQASK